MAGDGHHTGYDVSSLRARCVGPDRWRRLDVVAETGSTNADLIARAGAGEDVAGTVLIADHQTHGRGRHGRAWSAPLGSQLSMSVGVDCGAVAVDAWGWLPLATGVAVVDAVRQVAAVDAGLKWPNDVLAGERKLAGILAEVTPNRPVVVVGIGLNVGLTAEELPAPHATSLRLLGSPVLDRAVVAAAVLEALAGRVAAWQRAGGADAALLADYRKRSVTLGTHVRATVPGGGEVVGTAADLDEAGRLVIETGQGPVTVAAGDVTHLRPAGD